MPEDGIAFVNIGDVEKVGRSAREFGLYVTVHGQKKKMDFERSMDTIIGRFFDSLSMKRNE